MFNVAQERADFIDMLVANAGFEKELFSERVLRHVGIAFEQLVLSRGLPVKEESVRELLASPEIEAFEKECRNIVKENAMRNKDLIAGSTFIQRVAESEPNDVVVKMTVKILSKMLDGNRKYTPMQLFDISMKVVDMEEFNQFRIDKFVNELMNSLAA